MKCCLVGCDQRAVGKIKTWQGIFIKKKQGFFAISYNVCQRHAKNRGGDVDMKKLIRQNPNLKGAV
jgi:hypothetical protein